MNIPGENEIVDKVVEIYNALSEFSHDIMTIMEEWKRREEENHVILLKLLDDIQRIKKHLHLDQTLTEKTSYG